jgi:hypothetical protein
MSLLQICRHCGPLCLLLAGQAGALVALGLFYAPGVHDNDWPLLMWLAHRASWTDPSPLFIGHYGAAQLMVVRAMAPIVGGTIVAAKLISIIATLGCTTLVFHLARGLAGNTAGLMAALAFALSPHALLTGQSEFGDPAASMLFLLGLAVTLSASQRSALWGGVLMGTAGLVRTHFQFFSFMAALLIPLSGACGVTSGRQRLTLAALIIAGVLLGNGPGMAANHAVHGKPFSVVSHTFVPQVVFGVDDYNFLETYSAHTLEEVLEERPLTLLSIMGERFLAVPETLVIPLAIAAFALWSRRDLASLVTRRLLLLGGLCLGYSGAFVSMSWGITHRLLYPLLALMLAGAVPLWVLLLRNKHPRVMMRAYGLAVFMSFPLGSWHAIDHRLTETRRRWNESGALLALLRQSGFSHPLEAFVFDWNRFVVDDPSLQPYYNFGFWNLLVADFRTERPLPTPHMNNLEDFSRFMQVRNVRFIVFSRKVTRFPVLTPVLNGKQSVPGYRHLADVNDDVVFIQNG